jgi:hypothetical protein
VPSESLRELSPRHLVVVRKGGGEGRPRGTHRPVKLLGCEQRLLRPRAAKKTELSLGRAKPAVSLQRVCGLSEHRWVCHQVQVGCLMQLVLTWLLLLLQLMGLTVFLIHHQPLHESILGS